MPKRRRTKIVVTLGPSLQDEEILGKVIRAGADVFRVNFSHGTNQQHQKSIEMVRAVASEVGREVAIFADLQGPKIRIAQFKNHQIELNRNDEFILDASLGDEEGDESQVGIDYKALPHDVSENDTLLLDDGRIILVVKEIVGQKIICRVKVGGELSDHKGLNRQGGGLSAGALTEKDRKDIKFAANLDIDYFALSFPRSAADVEEAKSLIAESGKNIGIISKIERTEAIEALDDIIAVSDAVMVARGDLGVEIGDAALPGLQKHIVQRARSLDKPVIIATQMMESMIHNRIPTRAEVFDVANAVLDNTDAVMLSAETAVGDHPELVVASMSRICLGAEKQPEMLTSKHRLECHFKEIDEAIAMAAMYCANHIDIAAIITLTESGSTPLLMSRIRTGIPIFALTRNESTLHKVNLYRGVYPMPFDITQVAFSEINQMAIMELKQKKILQDGDLVIVTKGDVIGVHGHTNSLKIYKVGEDV